MARLRASHTYHQFIKEYPVSYCYCTPSRALSWNQRLGTKGYQVSVTRSDAAIRGWETRRRHQEWHHQRLMAQAAAAEAEHKAREAAEAEAAEAARQTMVIAGTVPETTIVAEPVEIAIEGD